jgi:hypothetical protein
MRENLEFNICSEQLWEILQNGDLEISNTYCAVIFSDCSLAESIPLCGKIIIKDEGISSLGNLQTNLLSVNIPQSVFPSSEIYFSEALASILSFSFRSRFQASRRHSRHDENGNLCRPFDTFIRVISDQGGFLTPKCPSLKSIKERNLEFLLIINVLKKTNPVKFETLMKSFHLYQLSQLTRPLDVGLAYSLLVSSIDTISSKLYKGSGMDEKAKFIKFIEDFLPLDFWSSFDSKAVEEDRYDQQRFHDVSTKPDFLHLEQERENYEKIGITHLKFILNDSAIKRLEKAFKNKEDMPLKEKEAYEHVLRHWYLYNADSKLTRDELSKTLKTIYSELRSAFFHSGKTPSKGAFDNYETAKITTQITCDNKMIAKRDIPSFYWFERVAHDCILNYLTKNFDHAEV